MSYNHKNVSKRCASHLAAPHINGEVNELGIFLHQVLDGLQFKVVRRLLLHHQTIGGGVVEHKPVGYRPRQLQMLWIKHSIREAK